MKREAAAPRAIPGLAVRVTRWVPQLGRVDLTEVEGLADLLAAETRAQQRQASGLSTHPCHVSASLHALGRHHPDSLASSS